MSYTYMTRAKLVLGCPALSSTQRLLLLAISDHADGEGRTGTMRVEYLEGRTSFTARTIRRTAGQLEALGVLERELRPGNRNDKKGNRYRILFEHLQRLAAAENPDTGSGLGEAKPDRRSALRTENPDTGSGLNRTQDPVSGGGNRTQDPVKPDTGSGSIGIGSLIGSLPPPSPPSAGREEEVDRASGVGGRSGDRRGAAIAPELRSLTSQRERQKLQAWGLTSAAALRALDADGWAELRFGVGDRPALGEATCARLRRRLGLDPPPGPPPDEVAEALVWQRVVAAVGSGRYPPDAQLAQAIQAHLGHIEDLGRRPLADLEHHRSAFLTAWRRQQARPTHPPEAQAPPRRGAPPR